MAGASLAAEPQQHAARNAGRCLRISGITGVAVLAVQLLRQLFIHTEDISAPGGTDKAQPEVQTATASLVWPEPPRKWCPGCKGELCKKRFLFVVGTGRCGSTTLMNMVNLVPGIYIQGENHALVDWLVGLNASVSTWKLGDVKVNDGLAQPHSHVPPDLQLFLKNAQLMLWDLLPPPPHATTSVWVRGYKEIRWTEDSLWFVAHACPCSRFIFNYRRDLNAQHKSLWLKRTPLKELKKYRENLTKALSDIKANKYDLPLESFSVTEYDKLAKWLGVPCHFDRVLQSSYKGTYDMDLGPPVSCKS